MPITASCTHALRRAWPARVRRARAARPQPRARHTQTRAHRAVMRADSTKPRVGRTETGAATAEYAVGTVATACIGCVLFYLADGEGSFFFDLITSVVDRLRSLVQLSEDVPGPYGPWLM